MPKVRKQIYLEKKQDQQLKRLAEARGVSEAEVIRQTLDQRFAEAANRPAPPDANAWRKAHATMLQLLTEGPLPQAGRRWTRAELYEERMSRYGPDSD